MGNHAVVDKIKNNPKSDAVPRNRSFLWQVALIVAALILVAALGDSFGHQVLHLTKWIASQGTWGPIVFLIVFIILSSVFVPDTVFAIIAGTLFGILWGTVLMFTGGVIAAVLNFYLARKIFGKQVRAFLEKHPKLSVVEHATESEGIRLLLLLRLVPINPALVSYLLGTSGIRFLSFLVACLGLIPGFFVEVYFGYLIKHVSTVTVDSTRTHSTFHTVAALAGFAVCLVTFAYLTVVARRALSGASLQQPDAA
jgi:uncharacterized membrane protein YdjX (TVP38/TMEM64 family)